MSTISPRARRLQPLPPPDEVSSQEVGANQRVRPWGKHFGLPLPRIIEKVPDKFMFGVANSDHQCEARNPDSFKDDMWDVWEREHKLVPRGDATDFWNRYKDDIGLAKDLGCTAFRFSIAWSRVEPEPGRFSQKALDHYRDLVTTIRDKGMEPIVTLHHFTWPRWVEVDYDWESSEGGVGMDDDWGFPGLFVNYTERVVERLGKDVRWWITFNEPSQLIYGYLRPWWEDRCFMPPGLPWYAETLKDQVTVVAALMRSLFKAHTDARIVIQNANRDALVGANPLLLGLPPWLQSRINRIATDVKDEADLAREVQRVSDRPSLLLERGEVDVVIATFTRTEERAQQVLFSDLYFVASQRLLVKADSPASSAQDLAGKVVVVIEGSTAKQKCPELIPEARMRVVGDESAALDVLDRAQADAFLADDTMLQWPIAEYPGKYKLIGEPLVEEPYAAAVARGNWQLLGVINSVIRDFKESGAWAESYATYLGEPVPEPPGSPAQVRRGPTRTPGTMAEEGLAQETVQPQATSHGPLPEADPGTGLRRVQDRGRLIVAVKSDVPGLGYRDEETGQFHGLEIDLARALAKRIFGDPDKVRFRPTTTQKRIPLLRSVWRRVLDPLLETYSILSTMLLSHWWHLGMAGELEPFLCPEHCVGQQDFVGLDYYWGINTLRLPRIKALADAAYGRFDQAPVWPDGLYILLRDLDKMFGKKLPFLIAENGSVGVADGVKREDYIRQHVRQVQRAVADGVDVAGYIYWSITTNREWGRRPPENLDEDLDKSLDKTDFGLYRIDLDTDPNLVRKETDAAREYQRIIARRGV